MRADACLTWSKSEMFKLLSRFAALVLSAIAFAALIVDATKSILAGTLMITPLGTAALAFAPVKTASLYDAFEKHVPAVLLEPILATLPRAPVWLAIGLAAFVLFCLSRESPPAFGYSSR
jgi:hypothetical protein